MPATNHQVERISLRFIAENPSPPRSILPGGWWLWCLLGIGVGLGGWLLSREYLAKRLGQQLSEAKSRPEAMLALEGLLLLDSTASNAIVAGLQNEDFAVARTAFRAIESQIQRWQQFAPTEAKSRMESLAQSLQQLPDTTPTENLILASSLASRMFTLCLEREDADLKSTMQICEQVIARVGKGRIDLAPETLTPEARVAVLADTGFASSDNSEASELSESTYAANEYTANLADPLSMPPPPLPQNSQLDSQQDSQSNSGRAPELFDSSSNTSLKNSTEDLSSTGGRASLRLVASPVRGPQTNNPPASIVNPRSPTLLQLADAPSTSTETVSLQTGDEPSAKTLAGIEHLPIQDLVRLLGSVQPKIAQAAALALRRHGMSDSKLELAMELATGTEQRRLEILEQFPTRTDLDPRVWLLWMAQEGQTEVRGRAIAQLSSMLDQDVMRELRLLLNRERDPEIAQLIRKTLITR